MSKSTTQPLKWLCYQVEVYMSLSEYIRKKEAYQANPVYGLYHSDSFFIRGEEYIKRLLAVQHLIIG